MESKIFRNAKLVEVLGAQFYVTGAMSSARNFDEYKPKIVRELRYKIFDGFNEFRERAENKNKDLVLGDFETTYDFDPHMAWTMFGIDAKQLDDPQTREYLTSVGCDKIFRCKAYVYELVQPKKMLSTVDKQLNLFSEAQLKEMERPVKFLNAETMK